jgi:hypothetical protein
MRNFFDGDPLSAIETPGLIDLSGWGDGFLIMLPAPGRSANPVRGTGDVCFVGDRGLGASDGIPVVGRAVMTTSSGFVPLLFGRCSGDVAYALAGPGEFSLRNEEGSRDRAGSFDGESNLPLPPLEDGVDGIGEFGSDFSSM